MFLETEALIRELARGLVPVRRVARLLISFLCVAGLWVLFAGLLAVPGTPLSVKLASAATTGAGAGILAGLATTAVGGVLLALAARIPGRNGARGAGAALVGVGLVVAVVSAWLLGPRTPVAPLAADLACLGKAVGLGLLPGACLGAWVVRGAPLRSGLALHATVFGAIGLGAGLVHLGCAWPSVRHLLLGHALAPLLAGLPLAWLLRRVPGLR